MGFADAYFVSVGLFVIIIHLLELLHWQWREALDHRVLFARCLPLRVDLDFIQLKGARVKSAYALAKHRELLVGISIHHPSRLVSKVQCFSMMVLIRR